MSKAYISETQVIVKDFQEGKALCYIPSLDICNWYRLNEIEVVNDQD